MSEKLETESLAQMDVAKLEGSFFWERYKLAIIALIFLGIGSALFYTYLRVTKAVLNTKAQEFFDAQNRTEDLQQVVDKYPGTPAAAQALLVMGETFYSNKEWDETLKVYSSFLESFPKHEFSPNALMGVGGAYEAKGDLEKAADQYRKVYENFPESYRAAEAKLALAQVYERQGQKAKAKQIYESIPAAYPQSVWRNFATEQAKRLEAEKS